MGGGPEQAGGPEGRLLAGDPKAMAEVLASIRALVSAEAAARQGAGPEPDAVLMLTPDMRVDQGRAQRGEVLAEGIEPEPRPPGGAPILDEEALRGVVNRIVREELQGELGDRISRNLRKLIRREIGQLLEDKRGE
jgi:hypothetical protein